MDANLWEIGKKVSCVLLLNSKFDNETGCVRAVRTFGSTNDSALTCTTPFVVVAVAPVNSSVSDVNANIRATAELA